MWLSIHFSHLPLQSIERHSSVHNQPQGVMENNHIICINQKAAEYGIKINHKISHAYSLCDELQLFERNVYQEQQQLENIALSLYAYSPSIVIEKNNLLLIEISHCLKLYKNCENLTSLIKRELKKTFFNYHLAIGKTAESAKVYSLIPSFDSFCFWLPEEQKINLQLFKKKLSLLPIEAVNLPEKTIEQIKSIGVQTVGEFNELNTASVSKRFGRKTVNYFLTLYGKRADPKQYFIPPEIFSQKTDFINVIHHRQGLHLPIKQLIDNLCQFLTIQQKSCQQIQWQLFDSKKNCLQFDVSTSEINNNTLISLTLLALERYTLQAPVEAIQLKVDKLTSLSSYTEKLFSEAHAFNQNNDFIYKIRAKLGYASCYTIQQQAEHIPELASCSTHKISEHDQSHQKDRRKTNNSAINNELFCHHNLNQPAWLLKKPIPILFDQHNLLWRGKLTIISSQQRIAGNWWKNKITRDYFLAEHENGVIYWIFFDLQKKQWFIHGIYS